MQFHDWRTSSYTATKNECVEVGRAPGHVGVRDSKDRAGGQLAVAGGTWRTFVAGIARAGR